MSPNITNLTLQIYKLLNDEKIPLYAFFDDNILSSVSFKKLQQLPFFVKYTFKHIIRQNGCKEVFENFSELISYYISIDNSYYSLSRHEILLLNNTGLKSEIELYKIEEITEKIVDVLYYFFDEFDLKLNSIKLNFSRADNNLILYLKLTDSTFLLNDIKTGKSLNLDEIAEKIK